MLGNRESKTSWFTTNNVYFDSIIVTLRLLPSHRRERGEFIFTNYILINDKFVLIEGPISTAFVFKVDAVELTVFSFVGKD
jgi:hypothetical protein